jgi:threonine/homoserine/homoserine lactone efflux protein
MIMSDAIAVLAPHADAAKMAAALSSFWLGYLIILAVPGPNLLVVSYVAATHGLRSAMPIALAISCGAALLFTAIHTLADIAGPAFRQGLSFMSVVLLFFSAFRILRAKAPSGPHDATAPRRLMPDLMLGLACGFTNPVTAAYFTAVVLGGNTVLFSPGMAAPLAISTGTLCGGFAISAAALFSRIAIRKRVMRHFDIVKCGAAALIAGFGVATAIRTLELGSSNLMIRSGPLADMVAAAQR